LPWTFDGVVAESATVDEGLAFVDAHFATIFNPLVGEARFVRDVLTPAKRRFAAEMDIVAFRDGATTVGMWMSHPTDWSSYYLRSYAFLENYRDRRIGGEFLTHACGLLREAGVDRVDVESSPTNFLAMRALTRMGWVVTATANSERWGAVVRLSRFLREDAETVFHRQFCGLRNGRAGRPLQPGSQPEDGS
jgi:ribosomal protein S18 acetylase RimI-like enzyme